jgi:dihydrofolate reductase
MRKIIYYVATSLDGYISGPNDDVSMFSQESDGIKQYLSDLQDFQTVIMGRKTYEFGYQYGIQPGQPAYPHMEHYIFSDHLEIQDTADSVHIEKLSLDRIRALKETSKTDIYLCGGGQFAGWLLENKLIDILKIKLNPIILGEGVQLFGGSSQACKWLLVDRKSYSHGLEIINLSSV